MTAEEMAPYLEPPEPSLPSSAAVATSLAPPYPYPDESFVLPALIKFGGEAVVDDATGGLLYRFPSLQRTGVKHKVRGVLLGRERAFLWIRPTSMGQLEQDKAQDSALSVFWESAVRRASSHCGL